MAALVLASMLPLVAALVYTIRAARVNATSDAQAASVQSAQLVAANVAKFVADTRALMTEVSKRPLVAEMRSGRCDPLLESLIRLHVEFANAGLIDLHGTVHCSAVMTTGPVSVAASPWFKRVRRTGRFTISDPWYGPIVHRWVSVFSLPLRQHGTVAGYLGVPIDLVRYQGYLLRVGSHSPMLTGVFDSARRVVVRSQNTARWVGRPVTDLGRASSHNGVVHDRNGVERIVGLAPVPGTAWTAYAGAPTSTAFARSRSLTYAAIGAGLFSLLLAALVALALSRGITRPIRRLAAAASRVGEGETDERVPLEGPTEIALAAEQFNLMVESRLVAAEEQRRLSAQLAHSQKLESMGRLAGGVAHDLNNMLVVIGGYAAMLRARAKGPEETEPLDEIAAAAERAGTLTQQLLAFGRRQVLQPTVLDVNALVSELERMLGRLLGDDIRLTVSLEPGLASVVADRAQLEQVVTNLVVNASDALPDGGEIELITETVVLDEDVAQGLELEPGRYVLLCVADDGVGMDEATRSHALEPFFTTKEPGKGTGLGLASAYGAISQSGGGLSLVSAPGEGTRVCIYLPPADVEAAEPELEQAEPPLGNGEHVLLVEDEDSVRAIFGSLLESLGYRVSTASEATEALALITAADAPFDLLVTDVAMPGMGGRELATRLRDAGIGLPILFVSGYAPQLLSDGLAPRTAFLAKPFTRRELAARVRALVDGRS